MKQKNINIREAREDEYQRLIDIEYSTEPLFKEYGYDFSNVIDDGSGSSYLPSESTTPYAIYVAINNQDNPIGFCSVKMQDNNAYIAEISILPKYTKQGIGTKLMQTAINWAKENNYEYITLTTFRDIPFNAPFYKKLGFKEFTPDKNWQGLKAQRDIEKRIKLDDMSPRIAMIKKL